MTNNRIFITGAGGFIGSNLTKKLSSLGYDIHIILKPGSNPFRLNEIKDRINIHSTDLLDKAQLPKLLKKINPNIIYHLATHGAYSFQNDREKIIDVNIMGTLNLLEASRKIDYGSLIVTGTSSEYGFKKHPMKETDALEPTSFYAASKASTTLISQVFAKEFKKPISILRPFSVYGPYEEKSRFVPTIIRALFEGKEISLTSGSQRRDLVYIDDVVDAYLSFLSKNRTLEGEVFNLGTGRQYTNDDVVKILFKVTGKKTKVKKGAFPKKTWDTSFWVADISKSKKILKWQPKVTLEEGLKKTYKWFAGQSSLKDEKI